MLHEPKLWQHMHVPVRPYLWGRPIYCYIRYALELFPLDFYFKIFLIKIINESITQFDVFADTLMKLSCSLLAKASAKLWVYF